MSMPPNQDNLGYPSTDKVESLPFIANRAMAQKRLTEHKQSLEFTVQTVEGMSHGAVRDALRQLLPVHQAEAEVMQAILDVVSSQQ
jgi:hypothetical protein